MHHFIRTNFRQPSEAPTVLDVGCGTGGWLQDLLINIPDTFSRGVGIDLNASEIRRGIERNPVSNLKLLNSDICGISEKFDLVTSFFVLEHIKEDFDFVNILAQKTLKKGGYLCLLVPAHEMIYKLCRPTLELLGHYRHYSKQRLKSIGHGCDLDIAHIYSVSLWPVTMLGILLMDIKNKKTDLISDNFKHRTINSQADTYVSDWYFKNYHFIKPLLKLIYGFNVLHNKAKIDFGDAFLAIYRK